MNIVKYVEQLSEQLELAADPERIEPMEKYMRNKFHFYGLNAGLRREIVRDHIAKNGIPAVDQWLEFARLAWEEPREMQYAAIDIFTRRKKDIPAESTDFLEFIITQKSWWDTIDAIATHLVGQWVLQHDDKKAYIEKYWLGGNNLWLQRSSIIFQLKYREKTDLTFLKNAILQSSDHPDFFIRKAIGWILREYSKTDSEWVIDFVNKYELSNLSKREALKWLNNKK